MDYQLTKVGEGGQMAFGSTWAAEIRAAHYFVPVIGISHERVSDIPGLRLESFLAFFPREHLMGPNPPLEDLAALLSGYNRVCKLLQGQKSQSGVDLVVSLVKPPKFLVDLVRASVPSAIRGPWDKETPHAVGRWLWHELQGRPGFLLDELGLVTSLGLKVKALCQVSSKFDSARYSGAFASDGRPRWWVGMIRSIVEETIGSQIVGPISNGREELLKALKVGKSEIGGLLSRAHGNKSVTEIPDCVAYRDDQREEGDRIQALFRDTYVDDRDANPPFGFEARRVFCKSQSK